MDPLDPRYVWLYAAEMTALLRQAVHKGGRRHHLAALVAARGVAARLYAGEVDTPALARALSTLEDTLCVGLGDPSWWAEPGFTGKRRAADGLALQALQAYNRMLVILADTAEDQAA